MLGTSEGNKEEDKVLITCRLDGWEGVWVPMLLWFLLLQSLPLFFLVPCLSCSLSFYIHLWYWSALEDGIFIIIIVINIKTDIIVCCADVIIGFMCRLMSLVGEGEYKERCSHGGVAASSIFGSIVG